MFLSKSFLREFFERSIQYTHTHTNLKHISYIKEINRKLVLNISILDFSLDIVEQDGSCICYLYNA